MDGSVQHKRLGDGFYEQRQVLDQIAQLTGRRFLSDDTDALAQYRSLMDAGVQAAGAFDLSVGVAFTGEQMAALTPSVTEVSGIGAGNGGYQIHVGGNTDLTGAVIASTAEASKNLLDTGTLSYRDLENEASYSAIGGSVSIGRGGYGSGGSISVPQFDNEHGTTKAGLAQGTITVRDGHADLNGLDRNPDLDAKGLGTIFEAQKVAERQELGQAAGYVGMRVAGTLAEEQQKKALADYKSAKANGDTTAMADAQARMNAWGDSGTNKVLLHGMVGAATAALGGGNVLQGALGAGAGELASQKMQDYLVKNGIDPNSNQGKALMDLASAAIGSAAGGGAGAATALDGEQFNRQLHEDEIAKLKQLKEGKSEEEQQRLTDAACALAHCAAGVPDSDPLKATMVAMEQRGQQDTAELAQLQATGLFTYNGDYASAWGWDSTHDWGTRNQAGTRALGGLQWLGGNLQTVGGVAAGTTCETGFGCFAAGYLVTTGYDNAAGFATMVNGTSVATWGGQVLQGMGLSPQSAELLYGASQIGVALAPAIKTNVSSLLASRGVSSAASGTPVATALTDSEAGLSGVGGAKDIGVSTPSGAAYFWSGLGPNGDVTAAEVASGGSGVTLEQTAAARGINLPTWDASNPAVVEAWYEASRAFADGANGEVHVVLGNSMRPGNVWETVELPALKANPKVTQIVRVDPATGKKTVIFRR